MNTWKALALIMITLLIIVAGIRFAYVEKHVFQLNEMQKTFAINAARGELRDEMAGNGYNVTVSDRGWIIPAANGDKKVVHVVFTRGNMTLAVLVDIDTGDVVEKTRVERSGWMTEYRAPLRHRLFLR